jgi:phage terminase small subunit
MPSGLTPKQEKFAREVASGKNQSDAYREAYDAGKMKASSINVNASKLMADAKVAQRVADLRKPIAAKAQMTLESHLRDLMMLRNMAVKEKQISAAISAEIARGKAAGVHIERTAVEVTHADDDDALAAALADRLERGQPGATRH